MAQGVIGIAFIQMMLVGLGFALMGVPGTGLLCLAVLMLGIVQLPATLMTLPVIVLVLATMGASAGHDHLLDLRLPRRPGRQRAQAADARTRGRCADAGGADRRAGRHGHRRHHRPVHRPVVLAVGYQLFWQWVEDISRQRGRARSARPRPGPVPAEQSHAHPCPADRPAGTGVHAVAGAFVSLRLRRYVGFKRAHQCSSARHDVIVLSAVMLLALLAISCRW